ncbi:hypothetical protein [Massilia sp. BJB1822]|uniref:hypothetical protein n=1 Tax=Massilia sp. BJB1822 TaxID=2744470 RepID=UPI0015945B6D|nr:hypothetical protein [Massilia sp. BJB1822]NVD99518.1 hypothetical protein [Massilia sp. BJB1822]
MSKISVEVKKDLLDQAREYFETASNEELVEKAFSVFLHWEAGRWIVAQGGTQPDIEDIPRRRWEQR